MSKKKKKAPLSKNSPQKISNQSPDKKKLRPLPRTMLLVDLVFLAGVQLLCDNDILAETPGNIATLLGALVLLAALYIQFCRPDEGQSGGEKRLGK